MTNIVAQIAIPTEKRLFRGESPIGKTKKLTIPIKNATIPGIMSHSVSTIKSNYVFTYEIVHPLKIHSYLVSIVFPN